MLHRATGLDQREMGTKFGLRKKGEMIRKGLSWLWIGTIREGAFVNVVMNLLVP
jgi:hypothetical protein